MIFSGLLTKHKSPIVPQIWSGRKWNNIIRWEFWDFENFLKLLRVCVPHFQSEWLIKRDNIEGKQIEIEHKGEFSEIRGWQGRRESAGPLAMCMAISLGFRTSQMGSYSETGKYIKWILQKIFFIPRILQSAPEMKGWGECVGVCKVVRHKNDE